MNKNNKILLSTIFFVLFTFFSRIFGLIRDIIIFHLFGINKITDLFYLSLSILSIIKRFLGEGTIQNIFIPYYTTLALNEKKKIFIFTKNIYFFFTSFNLLVIILCIMYIKNILTFFSIGITYDPIKYSLCLNILKILFPYLLFFSLSLNLSLILQIHNIFIISAISPLIFNLSLIFSSIFSFSKIQIPLFSLILSIFIYGIIEFLIHLIFIIKIKKLFLPSPYLCNYSFLRFFYIFLFNLISILTYKINIIIIKQFTSFLPFGHVTYYYNADRFIQFILGIFTISISIVLFPTISKLYAKKKYNQVNKSIQSLISLLNFITIPSSLGLISIAYPLSSFIYYHGQTSHYDINLITLNIICLSPSIIFLSINKIIIQFLYIKQKFLLIFFFHLSSVILYLFFLFLFSKLNSIGLSLTLTFSYFIQSVLLINFIYFKFNIKLNYIFNLKILILSIISSFFSFYLISFGSWTLGFTYSNLFFVFFTIFFTVLFYFFISFSLKIKQLYFIINMYRR